MSNNRQGGDVMKKLAMSALFVVLLCGSAVAHNGALSLYTDQTIQVCSGPIGSFEIDTIGLYYVRDNGPDLGNAVEFKLEFSIVDALLLGTEWNSQFSVFLGDVLAGISATATNCIGASEPIVYIASFQIMYSGFVFPPETFTARIVPDPSPLPENPAVLAITACLPGNPIYEVLGGTFVFNGSCNPGVTESSWGAIKELYR